MATSWPCPQCGASCKTVETLEIHLKRCRAMSVEEIAGALFQNSTDEADDGKWIEAKDYYKVAKAIHSVHIAKLRGRKS